MKLQKILIASLCSGSLLAVCSCSKDDIESTETRITYADLPVVSQKIITENFADAYVTQAVKKNNPESDGTLYKTWLSNSFKINFDVKGSPTDIEGHQKKIPDNMVHPNILSYVNQHYSASVYIRDIDKEHYGYEVELSNDVELKFDNSGNFMSAETDNDSGEISISYSSLPKKSRIFTETHFPGITVSSVVKNKVIDSDGILYELKLSNGAEIDFDPEGNWMEVENKYHKIPSSIIPSPILLYTQQNYPVPLFVKGIKKKIYGYKTEISNGVDLKFDINGIFLGIDD